MSLEDLGPYGEQFAEWERRLLELKAQAEQMVCPACAFLDRVGLEPPCHHCRAAARWSEMGSFVREEEQQLELQRLQNMADRRRERRMRELQAQDPDFTPLPPVDVWQARGSVPVGWRCHCHLSREQIGRASCRERV